MTQQTLDERAFHAGRRAGLKACSPALEMYTDREALARSLTLRYVKRVTLKYTATERQKVRLIQCYGTAFLDALEDQLEERFGIQPGCRMGWI